MSISNYLENVLLDEVFNGLYPTVYVSLHTADPGETGGNEVSGNGYARLEGSFSYADGSEVHNTIDLIYLHLPSGEVTHWGIWTNVASGYYLWGGEFLEEHLIGYDDGLAIYSGGMIISLD